MDCCSVFLFIKNMPELPEVQTTVNGLINKVRQRIFFDVWSDIPRKIHCYLKGRDQGFTAFRTNIKGRKVLAVRRIAKNIIMDLSGGWSLQIHQKMTGHLLYGKWQRARGLWQAEGSNALKQDPMNRFIHLLFSLNNGMALALSDARKFAKIALWRTEELKTVSEFQKIGPDALDPKLSLALFQKRLTSKKGRIKTVLMDQQVVAGLGNIYADEILFRAKIQPQSLAQNLSPADFKKIYQAIRAILKKAVLLGGTSSSDYRNINGEKGRFAAKLKVYQRTQQPCLRCGGTVRRIVLGSRSAHFCPVCQQLK